MSLFGFGKKKGKDEASVESGGGRGGGGGGGSKGRNLVAAQEEEEEEEEVEEGLDPDTLQSRANHRLIVTAEGDLDKSLLIRTEGWMYKKGGTVNARGGRHNWKKRWFVLEEVEFRNQIGYELVYYEKQGGKMKGSVGLSEVVIYCEARSHHQKVKYEFQLSLPNGGSLQLSCDDATEREEWIETINMIIAYLRTLTHPSAMVLNGYDPLLEDEEDIWKMGEEIAQNCQAYGSGLGGAEAGMAAQFGLMIFDKMGQQVTRGGMPVTCTISNEDHLYYVRVRDNQDGTYSAHYVLGSPGIFQLSIRINDEHEVQNSPFEIEIIATKTVAEKCTSEGEALYSVQPFAQSQFTIIARDAFGNPKRRGGDPFEVGIMGPAQLVALEDNANGTYTCTLEAQNPASAGFFAASSLMLLVTLHGKHITGSPFRPIIAEDTSQQQQQQQQQYQQAMPPPQERVEEPAPMSTPAASSLRRDRGGGGVSGDASVDTTQSSVSRLERARQRAMQAKAMLAAASGGGDDQSINEPPPPPPLADMPPGAKLESMARKAAGAEPGSRLAALGARGGGVGAAAASSSSSSSSLATGTKAAPYATPLPTANVLKAQLERGLVGPCPDPLSDEERAAWISTNQAFASTEVVAMLMQNIETLKSVFDILSEQVESAQVLKYTNSSNGGMRRLLEEYNVLETFSTKTEVKSAFILAVASQRNSGADASSAGGGNALEFISFVKALVLVAVLSLTKSSTFSSMYTTSEAKVEVMLSKWGLADPNKLATIREQLRLA